MGLFGFGKKKAAPQENTIHSKAATQLNNQLFRDLTQDAGVLLYKMGIAKEPHVKFFNDDGGILLGLFVQHTTNPQILAVKSMSMDMYLKVCGMHALGAGMYVTYMQSQFHKPVEQFSSSELAELAHAWERTDAYELALRTFGIPLQSQQKSSLDQIYMFGTRGYTKLVGNALDKAENVYTFMQVMFNAGITVALEG